MALEVKRARIVAIVGPTASGKSDLAMAAAQRLSGEIVSCDSVQVYRGLDVGSGKPSIEDRARVPHHLLDILELDEAMSAARFAQLASVAIPDIASRGRLPIVTGGTGLYLTALLKGLFEQREPSAGIRSRLSALADRHGTARLYRLLSAKDPEYAAKTQPSDRVRTVRALEVYFAMGRPFSRVQRERRPAIIGEVLLVGLNPGREEIRTRVTSRVAGMLRAGLVRETERALDRALDSGSVPRALGAIGYREVVGRLKAGTLHPQGDVELERAIVTSTMQYAKRQMTYFRHQFDVEWFAESDPALQRIEAWAQAEGTGK